MSDYGRPLTFGLSVVPEAARFADIVALAQEADRLGLDIIGVQDHPYQRRFLDTMSLLPALAAYTTHVKVFPDVANLPLRHPAMLAKASASIDVMSGGRFELGLGAGAFWEAIEAMGGPRRSPGEALAALREAIELMRAVWASGGGVRFEGVHYQVRGAKVGPPPVHPIEIWLGVLGPRALRLVGEVADGWLPSAGRTPLPELVARHETIDEAAVAAGRSPAAVRRLLNFGPALGLASGAGSAAASTGDAWVDRIAPLALESGFDTFVFWPAPEGGDLFDQVRSYASAAPAIREAVAAARA